MIKKHDGQWRKISLSPAPEGQPMKRVRLGHPADYMERNPQSPLPPTGPPVETPTPRIRATPAPRSIYDEPWLKRILEGIPPPGPKRKRPGGGQGA